MSESTSRDVRATWVRRILITTVGIEAVILGGYGLDLVIKSATQKGTEAGAGFALAGMAVVLCAGLALVGRAAARGASRARAPIIVWQILQAAVAKEAISAGSAWGPVLAVLAVVAVGGAFWPGVLHDGQPSG
jgi:hypothetical protein